MSRLVYTLLSFVDTGATKNSKRSHSCKFNTSPVNVLSGDKRLTLDNKLDINNYIKVNNLDSYVVIFEILIFSYVIKANLPDTMPFATDMKQVFKLNTSLCDASMMSVTLIQ